VGGSGLYVRAALDVLEFPGTDPEVRARLEEEAERNGIGALARRLAVADPESATRLRDARRIVRALEVLEVTGRPFSSYMPRREYVQPAVQIGLDMNRQALHARLASRVGRMVDGGLVAEVRRLAEAGLREGKTASRALGYAQFLRVLDGESTVEQAAEETTVATRQFARRQATWFHADPRVHWLDALGPNVGEAALGILEP
jgi:tRNA dimethylallyltransferase